MIAHTLSRYLYIFVAPLLYYLIVRHQIRDQLIAEYNGRPRILIKSNASVRQSFKSDRDVFANGLNYLCSWSRKT